MGLDEQNSNFAKCSTRLTRCIMVYVKMVNTGISNFFAYFKFHSDWGRVIGKIKQNELDCRDTAPFMCQPEAKGHVPLNRVG